MGKEKTQPPQELLDKVMFIANIRDWLQRNYRDRRELLNVKDAHCQVFQRQIGSFSYVVGGFISKLKFTLEPGGSIAVEKYKPGDWESAVEAEYKGILQFVCKSANVSPEEIHRTRIKNFGLNQVHIAQMEKVVQHKPHQAEHWLTLAYAYNDAGRFKDAENAFKKACELEPNSVTRRCLGKFYLAVLSNSLGGEMIVIGLMRKAITTETWRAFTDATAESLGYSIAELRRLAKENLEEAYKLAKLAYDAGSEEFLELPAVIEKHLEYLQQLLRKRDEQISRLERLTQQEPHNAQHWSNLVTLYADAERFKDMEDAANKCLELNAATLSQVFDDPLHRSYYARGFGHLTLGRIYLAAFYRSHKAETMHEPPTGLIFGKDQNLTAESLGYTVEEVRRLAEENLRWAVIHYGALVTDMSAMKISQDIRRALDYLGKF